MFSHRKIIAKATVLLLVISLVLPAAYSVQVPKAQAQFAVVEVGANLATNVASTALEGSLVSKEFGLDAVLFIFLKIIIQQITADVVNWANSGFRGQPGFITNPDQWFGNLGDKVAGSFIDEIAPGLCSPFRLRVQLALAQNHIQNYRSQCTLTEVVRNFDNFTEDFYQGGWDGWFVMTQNKQNNPFGAYLDAKHELNVRLINSQEKINTQLEQGRGFLAWGGKCISPGLATYEINETTGERTGTVIPGDDPQNCLEWEQSTPGSVVESQLNNVLGSGVRQLELADEINEVVSSVITGLVRRLIGGLGGAGLSDITVSSDVSYYERVAEEALADRDRQLADAENDANSAREEARRVAQELARCEADPTCTVPDIGGDNTPPPDGGNLPPRNPRSRGGGGSGGDTGDGGDVPLPPPPDPPSN